MHIGVLGNADSWYVADIDRASRERGHVAQRIDFRSLTASEGVGAKSIIQGVAGAGATNGSEAPEPSNTGASLRSSPGHPETGSRYNLQRLDALIVRTMPPGSLEQVVFRMDVLARLEAAGVLVINGPKAIECAVDKYLATAKLAGQGLPVPPTIVCQDTEAGMEAFDKLGGDVVVKPLFGAEGRGIVRVSDPDLAFRTFRAIERMQSVLYLQQFIEHEGYDIRVLVLGDEIIGAFKRRNASDFRTNMARSATGEVHELKDRERDMAVRAVQVAGATFGGVDLLYDRSGECYVLEVNAVPGWRAFQRVTGIDVGAKLVAWLASNVRVNQ